jgi:hypothetical protein
MPERDGEPPGDLLTQRDGPLAGFSVRIIDVGVIAGDDGRIVHRIGSLKRVAMKTATTNLQENGGLGRTVSQRPEPNVVYRHGEFGYHFLTSIGWRRVAGNMKISVGYQFSPRAGARKQALCSDRVLLLYGRRGHK